MFNEYSYEQNQGYNASQNFGYRPPRITKAMVIQALQDSIVMYTGRPITQVVKVEEIEQKFRHACIEVGDVSYLDLNYFPVPELGIQVGYYFCMACGRLYIQKDFM